jgi:hypothetical protein
MHVSWTTLREQIFAKLRRPYRSEANMNEVGHGVSTKASFVDHWRAAETSVIAVGTFFVKTTPTTNRTRGGEKTNSFLLSTPQT